MNPGSSRPGSSGSDASLSEQMKQNIRKMNDLVGELQEEKQKVASLQQESSGRKRQLEENNATLEKRVRQLEHLNAQLEQFNSEREGILRQLQEEMSNYATIQDKFHEQEQSMQMIVRELEDDRQELLDELAVKDVMSSDSINDLSEEVNELNEQLDVMSSDITCCICQMPVESEGFVAMRPPLRSKVHPHCPPPLAPLPNLQEASPSRRCPQNLRSRHFAILTASTNLVFKTNPLFLIMPKNGYSIYIL